MLPGSNFWVVLLLIIGVAVPKVDLYTVEGSRPYRILLDTDMDTDDFFALSFLLKLNRSEFHLEVNKIISVNAFFFLCSNDVLNLAYIVSI